MPDHREKCSNRYSGGGFFSLRINRQSGNFVMVRNRPIRIVVILIIGALLAAGTGMAYRAFMAPWRERVREPLISALFVGVAYFVVSLLWLRRIERREELNRRDQKS